MLCELLTAACSRFFRPLPQAVLLGLAAGSSRGARQLRVARVLPGSVIAECILSPAAGHPAPLHAVQARQPFLLRPILSSQFPGTCSSVSRVRGVLMLGVNLTLVVHK